MTMYYAEITGWGKCLPPAVLTNQDLSSFMDTSDEWIQTRTGISTRRISHVNTSDLATVAAQRALDCAGLAPEDIDLVIVATCSPDSLIPNTASKVAQNLAIRSAAAFDLNAACTGFLYGLETATRMIQAGNYQHALIIGAERLSFFIDWTKRDTAVLFGDGAGAAVVSRTEQVFGLQSAKIGCDAKGRDILSVPKFGTSMERFDPENGYWDFNFVGKEIFKRAVKGMGAATAEVLRQAKLTQAQVDVVVPHQANIRIIQTLCDLSGIPQDKAFINIQNYGNTSAATIPIALCEAVEQGKVQPGNTLLLAAFGAGLTWGAGIIQWGERTLPINQSTAQLPECTQSATELIDSAIKHCKQYAANHPS
ncbi:ketoacyl-ACP synthase III [Vibrio sp. WXL210]|uniref:ketoacyl-ACP synthase III n=1 Tax=Vibrio sp. WXL210 TaxID=3450709 RepID=UPI003EC94363